jgi:hypothetical protein
MSSTRTANACRNALHFILYVELQLFQPDFFDEVFTAQVGGSEELLELCFVLPVLLCQTLILGVCFTNYVPRAPLCCGHAFLLLRGFVTGV